MVTELFDSIPQPAVTGRTSSLKRPYSSLQVRHDSPLPKNGSIQKNICNTMSTSSPVIPSLSPSVILDANKNKHPFNSDSSPKSYRLDVSNNLNTIDSMERFARNPSTHTAQMGHEISQRQTLVAQNGIYYFTPTTNTPKMMEGQHDVDKTTQLTSNTMESDKSKVVVLAQDSFEDIQFLTEILQNNIDDGHNMAHKEPLKSSDSSTFDEMKLDSTMDTLYADVNQYSNQTSFEEMYKKEDTEKTDEQGIMGSCSWDTSSSASSASSIGSHFEFTCSQDFSDMMSDFGVSDIDWGSVDMIKI